MAITFVAAGTKNDAAAAASCTPGLPAGLALNDYMVMAASTFTAVGITTPAGWTSLIHTAATGADDYLFGKLAGSSESAPTVSRVSGTGFIEAQIWAYRGVDTSTPIDAAAVAGSVAPTSNTCTQPNITTATANALVTYAAASQLTGTWSTPSGETLRVNGSASGTILILGVADQVVASPGVVTGQSWVQTSNGNLIALAVALKQAAAAATFVPQIAIIG